MPAISDPASPGTIETGIDEVLGFSMKLIHVFAYATVLVAISYLLDNAIVYTGRPSNLAYGLISIALSCPVFAHFIYRHRNRRIRNVTVTIAAAAVVNLAVALAVTAGLGGWGSLADYLAPYALPTLITVLPAWIGAAILGGVIGNGIHHFHHKDTG